MRICMITTFFGAHSFGGDAVYVDRLSRALLRRGHEVHVIYGLNAYNLVRGAVPLRTYVPPDGLHLHPVDSWAGLLSPLWTHQTGLLGFKKPIIRRILEEANFDVINYHNISLVGGSEVLKLGSGTRRPVKLMNVHEYWLMCPLSSLWKFDREVCRQPACVRCSIHRGRPPQLWRRTGALDNALQEVDALLFPSRHTLAVHREHGIHVARMEHVPLFLPPDWADEPAAGSFRNANGRPYFAASGRLVAEKGFQRLIPQMSRLPEFDLKIAGAGPFEQQLRQLAAGRANVQFAGQLSFPELRALYSGAVAVVVPSLFFETFGYVAVEAMSTGTPVIVHDQGALPELIQASGGGLTYRTDDELVSALRLIAGSESLRRQLGERGQLAVQTVWSEEAHLNRYLGLVNQLRAEVPESRAT